MTDTKVSRWGFFGRMAAGVAGALLGAKAAAEPGNTDEPGFSEDPFGMSEADWIAPWEPWRNMGSQVDLRDDPGNHNHLGYVEVPYCLAHQYEKCMGAIWENRKAIGIPDDATIFDTCQILDDGRRRFVFHHPSFVSEGHGWACDAMFLACLEPDGTIDLLPRRRSPDVPYRVFTSDRSTDLG